MKPDPIKAELKSSFRRIRDGFLLAGTGLIIALPHLYGQFYSMFPRLFSKPAGPERMQLLFIAELILYFFALFLFILIGILANQRAGLTPFKSPGFRKIIYAFALGILLIPISYLLYDHLVLALIPETYPRKLAFALAYPFSIAFPQELLNRFGLLSLLAWIFGKSRRKKILANVLASVLLTAFAWADFYRLVDAPLSAIEIGFFLIGSLLLNLISNEIYLKNGFWAALAFKFGLTLKFPLYFFLFF